MSTEHVDNRGLKLALHLASVALALVGVILLFFDHHGAGALTMVAVAALHLYARLVL
jgi:hypothetical protein